MEVYLENMDAMIKAGQVQMRAKIKPGLEEIEATELKATARHYEEVPRAEATCILTAL
jgi:hypothetical protein